MRACAPTLLPIWCAHNFINFAISCVKLILAHTHTHYATPKTCMRTQTHNSLRGNYSLKRKKLIKLQLISPLVRALVLFELNEIAALNCRLGHFFTVLPEINSDVAFSCFVTDESFFVLKLYFYIFKYCCTARLFPLRFV